jgi:hypothetical protein
LHSVRLDTPRMRFLHHGTFVQQLQRVLREERMIFAGLGQHERILLEHPLV